jgi:dipeptidyl aminopeptidase/acylaminoacyl peptidase
LNSDKQGRFFTEGTFNSIIGLIDIYIRYNPMSKINTIFLLLTSLLCSCRDEAESTTVESAPKKYFISASLTNEIPLEMLKAFTMGVGQNEIAAKLKYAVKSYKLVYATTYNGKPIQASGLIMVPANLTDKAPLISLQHGTTFEKSGAPSVTGQYSGMELFASAGYIALLPDYIGYGSSKEIFHPYYDKSHSAFAVIDMIKSAKEFLLKEKVPFNEKLYLAGYSEGGYVTLAAAEEIETNAAHGLTLSAVAAGAGGYDLLEMLKNITTDTHYAYPSYLAFVLMSYNNTYQWNKPLTYFFKSVYANSLSQHMHKNYGGSYINAKLTTNLSLLFDPSFYARLKQPQEEGELKQALKNNTINGWKTKTPIRLYHGTKDEIIPYANSETTLQNFKKAGGENVTLTRIPGGTHGSSFMPMLENFVPWFLSLK